MCAGVCDLWEYKSNSAVVLQSAPWRVCGAADHGALAGLHRRAIEALQADVALRRRKQLVQCVGEFRTMWLTKQAASNFMVRGRDLQAGSFCLGIGSARPTSGNSALRSGNLALKFMATIMNFEAGDRDLWAGSFAPEVRDRVQMAANLRRRAQPVRGQSRFQSVQDNALMWVG